MARYNVRDLLGHYVRPESAREKMCPHACCRGRRVHPANYPVVLPDKLLKRATDEDLAEGYQRGGAQRRAQIEHEMDRRDARDRRREAARERHQAVLTGRKFARYEETDRLISEAEQATNGYMVNRAGRDAGVSERELFTGPENRARKYATDELLEHWQTHPRPTAAHFAGKDTTLSARYTAPRRRRAVPRPRPGGRSHAA